MSRGTVRYLYNRQLQSSGRYSVPSVPRSLPYLFRHSRAPPDRGFTAWLKIIHVILCDKVSTLETRPSNLPLLSRPAHRHQSSHTNCSHSVTLSNCIPALEEVRKYDGDVTQPVNSMEGLEQLMVLPPAPAISPDSPGISKPLEE